MKSFWHILSFLKKYWLYALLNIGANAVSIVFSLVSLTMVGPFLGILFDKIAPIMEAPTFSFDIQSLIQYFYYQLSNVITVNGKSQGLLYICFVVAIVFFVKNVFRYIALYFLAPIRTGVVQDLRNDIYQKIVSLPLSFFSEKRKGDLIARTSVDVQEVEWGILSVLEIFFKEPVTILLYLGALIYISPKMTLFVLLVLPITGIIIAQIGRKLRRSSAQAQDKQGDIISIIEESIGGLRILKAFNATKTHAQKFAKENKAQSTMMTRVLRQKEVASPLTEILAIGVVVLVLFFGGTMILEQQNDSSLTAEAFITFMLIFSQVIAPAKAFSTAYYRIIKGIASMDRIEEILTMKNPIINKPNALQLTHFDQKFEYQKVGFAYDDQPNQVVLTDINATIQKGQTVALVGASGAGKSTIVDLLNRFFDTTDGDIFIDGHSIKDVDIHSLHDLIGIVSQEAILFNDTVFNNIALGNEHATKEAVIQSAKIANAHDFINQLEFGYETLIGDRGNKLSGGEKQRLTIARAILKNPPILILDEATSALDAESEKLVQDALYKLMQNRTSIIIAHRLSTIQHADVIWVMKSGKIVEKGTHSELMAFDSIYKKLAELQRF